MPKKLFENVPTWKLREEILRAFIGRDVDQGPSPDDWGKFKLIGDELLLRKEAPFEYVGFLVDEAIEELEYNVSADGPGNTESWRRNWFTAARKLLDLEGLYQLTYERDKGGVRLTND